VAEEPTPIVVEPVPRRPPSRNRCCGTRRHGTRRPATRAAEPAVAEHLVAEHSVEESHPAPPALLIAAPDAGPRPGDAELRDLFAGRAEEIFRTVASEAVEKVMWK